MRYQGKHLSWSVFLDGLKNLKDAQRSFALSKGMVYVDVESMVLKRLTVSLIMSITMNEGKMLYRMHCYQL